MGPAYSLKKKMLLTRQAGSAGQGKQMVLEKDDG